VTYARRIGLSPIPKTFLFVGPELVSELHRQRGMGKALGSAAGRGASRGGRLAAGWRRADRLSVRGAASAVPPATRSAKPLDSGQKSAIFNNVEANVPPDQPPSSVDSPLSTTSRRGLSATGIAFPVSTTPPPAQASVTIPGCGVTPPGLTN